ncbi:hypothetical protein CR983_01225 [Candidatus Saccharibacteria bacterium]|nr:MAG: hypothetical protein CR983_01225 [Candidatus Saccharibacteria bacterium]
MMRAKQTVLAVWRLDASAWMISRQEPAAGALPYLYHSFFCFPRPRAAQFGGAREETVSTATAQTC